MRITAFRPRRSIEHVRAFEKLWPSYSRFWVTDGQWAEHLDNVQPQVVDLILSVGFFLPIEAHQFEAFWRLPH